MLRYVAWELTVFVLVGFVSVTSFLAFIAVGVQQRWYRQAPTFVLLLVTAAAWAFFATVSLGFQSVDAKLAWLRIAIAVSGFVPPLFVVFTIRWAGFEDVITRPRLGLAFCEALAFALLSLTNQQHGLLWSSVSLPIGAPSPHLELTGVYHAHALYAYLLIMVGLAVLVSIYLNATSLHNRQAGLMLLGVIPPFLTNTLYTMDVSPIPHLDLTPFSFVFTAILYGYALFHFDLLERTPIAQQRAIELVGDGLIVVDASGHVADANAVAGRILGFEESDDRPFLERLDVDAITDLHGTTRVVTGPNGRHAYDVLVSELRNVHDEFTGHAVVFRDVSDRYEYEERLEVANRVLRHNLRNDMNVILGNAEHITDATTDAAIEGYAGNIHSKAEDLVSLSEKARRLSELRHVRTDDETAVHVAGTIHDIVAEFRREHPEVTFDVSCPRDVTVSVVTPTGFEVAVQNLVENAIEHNDAEDPHVSVVVNTTEDETSVSIQDNGPGLPLPEQELLQEGVQTPVQHTEGLGLWLTRWVAISAGGTVELDTTEAAGTTITLTFPANVDHADE